MLTISPLPALITRTELKGLCVRSRLSWNIVRNPFYTSSWILLFLQRTIRPITSFLIDFPKRLRTFADADRMTFHKLQKNKLWQSRDCWLFAASACQTVNDGQGTEKNFLQANGTNLCPFASPLSSHTAANSVRQSLSPIWFFLCFSRSMTTNYECDPQYGNPSRSSELS